MRWFLTSLLILGGAGYAWHSYKHAIAGALGLELREIVVPGQNRTPKEAIFWALNMVRGNHMWSESLSGMHARLESLPWVKSAAIQRRLPWTLIVTLIEKTPMAIWQNNGKKCIVDEDGNPIRGVLPESFPQLIILTGQEAAKNFYKLFNQLHIIKGLPPVVGASFLRSQRWNLYLKNGARIQLPQENRGKALTKLATYWPFIKTSPVVDLRFPDAIILQPCL
jgi:cell division protein FtsQ